MRVQLILILFITCYFIFKIPYYYGTWRDVFHCRPDNTCSHTARL